MSFLFISHASPDKADRIRPLVEVLIEEGEVVWIDRPGAGPGNLGLDQACIDRNRVERLQDDRPWPTGIQEALRASGVVIGCLSRAAVSSRAVLNDELSYAKTAGKLVTCIVDDLGYDELPTFGGLLDLRNHQATRLRPDLLREALAVRRRSGLTVEQLEPRLREEWEKVRGLMASADRVRKGVRLLRDQEVAPLAGVLTRVPVGPVFHVRHMPEAVLQAFGDHLGTPDRIEATLYQARRLLHAAFPEGFTERQIFVRQGQLPTVGVVGADTFWRQLFAQAGLKARRTVAAHVVCPAGRWALRRSGADAVADEFVSKLSTKSAFINDSI